jgi:hypothetical protein
MCVDAAVALHLQWRRDKQPSPYSTYGASGRQKRAKRSHAFDSSERYSTDTGQYEQSSSDAERRA